MINTGLRPVPIVKVCQNGVSVGVPPRRNDHLRSKRGVAQGWTKSATRSNRLFLWQVHCPDLGDNGHSFTLTVRDCPATAADWTRLRGAFMKRLKRLGVTRLHWLTEWQRRGVPHMHGCAWLPAGVHPSQIVAQWLAVAGGHGALDRGQDTKPLSAAVDWLKYLAKHADRGVYNYQRSAGSVPAGWSQSTGRMWGHTGHWPLVPIDKLLIDHPAYVLLRRITQRWRLANARAETHPDKRRHRIRSARRMLQANKEGRAYVRGTAEWMPFAATARALRYLDALGHRITWADHPED